MSNQKSKLEADTYYHIYNRANGSEQLFLNKGNYLFFLKRYQQHISPITDTLAYCLMPNHFHFVVRIKSIHDLHSLQGFQNLEGHEVSSKLTQAFSNLFNSYTKSFNKQNKRMGSLFIPRYNRKKIDSEIYLKNSINYIHLNPIAHKFAKSFSDWPYSSYHSIISNAKTNICRAEVLDLFDGLDNFISYHKETKTQLLEPKSVSDYLSSFETFEEA